jgi:hypothetical protein
MEPVQDVRISFIQDQLWLESLLKTASWVTTLERLKTRTTTSELFVSLFLRFSPLPTVSLILQA